MALGVTSDHICVCGQEDGKLKIRDDSYIKSAENFTRAETLEAARNRIRTC